MGGDNFGIRRHFHCQILAAPCSADHVTLARRVGCYVITGSAAVKMTANTEVVSL
jgi:hypothetical protein